MLVQTRVRIDVVQRFCGGIFLLGLVINLLGCPHGSDGSSSSSPTGDTAASDAAGRDTPGQSDTVVEPDATTDVQPDSDAAVADAADIALDTEEDGAQPPNDVVEEETGSDDTCTLGGGECGDGNRCVPVGPNESLVCRPAGTVEVGDECGEEGVDDCVAGAICVDYDDDASFCLELCSIGSEAVVCPNDYQFCYPYYGPAGSTAGICLGADCTPPAVGCPPGQRCTVLAGPVFDCVPEGDVPAGGDCAVEECEAGTICRNIDGESLCRRFCQGGSECVADNTHCAWPWQELTTEWGFCRPGCDPTEPETDCGAGSTCVLMDYETGETDCWDSPGTTAEGAVCDLFPICLPGSDCILEPDSEPCDNGCCRQFCDDTHGCLPERTCQLLDSVGLKVCMP